MSTPPSLVAASEALHARVRAFAAGAREGGESAAFDRLALDIARHQVESNPGYERLVAARGGLGPDADAIPAVPVAAFRLTRIATHPAELDVARFHTSGTTGGAPGVHAFRTLETYRALAEKGGRRALAKADGPRVVVALAPPETTRSSLGFMMRLFMESWDARPLSGEGPFTALEPGRWLLGPSGIDVPGLERAAALARRRGEPLCLLATGFALVLLLDSLNGASLSMPEGTVIMPTGGFKGRSREMDAGTLARELARTFGISESQIVYEYGMTELSSQSYESPDGARGVYVPPPWLRITAVDPETLLPLPRGEVGIARFLDLGNVDSAVALVTEDLVRETAVGVELLGRKPGAPSRGCSLAVEELVLGGTG